MATKNNSRTEVWNQDVSTHTCRSTQEGRQPVDNHGKRRVFNVRRNNVRRRDCWARNMKGGEWHVVESSIRTSPYARLWTFSHLHNEHSGPVKVGTVLLLMLLSIKSCSSWKLDLCICWFRVNVLYWKNLYICVLVCLELWSYERSEMT
jgi:hypothetical protein